MSEPIPLARPVIGRREEELVLEALRSGRLSLGPLLERFERDFADRLGVAEAVAVSSGTAALHLGVRALGWGRGDEVLTSPFSFVASANCLLYEGARPVFCDVDPVTLDLDPAAAKAAIGPRTAGILPVDIFGMPAALPELSRIAAGAGLGMLEDACEALGAVDSEGREVGTREWPATFAFYANKQMTTGEGDAGQLRPRGRRPGPLGAQPGPGARHGLARARRPRLQLPPLRAGLRARDRPARAPRRDAGHPRARRRPLRVAPLLRGGVETPPGRHGAARRSWFVYVVSLPEGADRDAVIADLAARGVASKAYLPCMHLFPHLRELGYREGDFPIAEAASARSLALPFHPGIGETEVERVATALSDALGRGAP